MNQAFAVFSLWSVPLIEQPKVMQIIIIKNAVGAFNWVRALHRDALESMMVGDEFLSRLEAVSSNRVDRAARRFWVVPRDLALGSASLGVAQFHRNRPDDATRVGYPR